MMRAARTSACLALILAAACGPKPRPATLRDLQGTDVSVCYTHAAIGNNHLAGDGTMMMIVDTDGAIPAAWFHDGSKIDSPQFFRCMTALSVENKIESSKTDHIFGWMVSCQQGGCGIHALNTLPPAPFEEALAQDSLTFADWADSSDKGWGYYYVHKYSDAEATFSSVLTTKPDDVRALRGLAQTLVESGGDLKRARTAAEKAVTLAKNAASLEALVRVCIKAGDDECAVKNFVDATKSEDVKDRSLDLAQLNDIVKAANGRLDAADKSRQADMEKAKAEAEAKMAKADPLGCYKMTGPDQAKCYVKRCFEAGAQAYAQQLTKASGSAYSAGEMSSAAGVGGATIVTIPIRSSGKKKGQNMDASWAVVLGDNVDMKPYKENLPAYNISKDHNACK